ncbi:uncharacterized protein LOC132270343 [Cornus florida]|uniref:uncharacterized protein LOC132270343 n=1 Tax=Cornus florida TaxID=4283 RepID=UPI00289FA9E2|nr:uncharacterized protein LOC132270343 [Cornus florida]
MVFDMNSLVESDWAWLPKNLLDVIMDRLDSQSDYVRFGAVCKPWRFVAMENKVKYVKNKYHIQVPLLMVPTKDNSEERRSLYNITHNKIYDFQLRVPYKKRCCGSSYGQIFAVDYWGGVIRIDVNSRDRARKAPKVKIIALRTQVFAEHTYLVESSSGDLLFVQRFMKEIGDDLQHETLGFKVFKLLELPHKKGYAKQIQVKNLGGDTMFLGDSHSTCISASKFPRCQPNSIYYTDDYYMFLAYPPYGRRDIGIFNVENGSFGTHYILDPSQRVTPPTIWIVPTVLGN